ncbi:hypothetical protein K443DRAFT_321962 [Laccaria amethystina LaAM-08-1]|uniref:Uncharacterized protein n=1 Tax=Laccaria amethystina LaAM-08-1 TaxID=1095629 RepID=A0A0C9WK13_9AGAR|nr:hypothetical protein K443DRAFT_321962 [Laccaria amethystina LaAM-08-1]
MSQSSSCKMSCTIGLHPSSRVVLCDPSDNQAWEWSQVEYVDIEMSELAEDEGKKNQLIGIAPKSSPIH